MCSRHSTFNFQAKHAASCKSGPNIDFNTQILHYQPPPPTPPPLPYKILFAIHFIKNFRGSLHCHLKYEALKPISHTTSCHLSWWVHYFLNIDSCYFCLYKTCGSYTSHIHVLPFNCSLCTHWVKPCFVEYNVARTQNKNQRLCLMYKYNNIKCI